MKRLILIRHAKTHPAAFGQRDFDRMLTERGFSDASMMAERLKKAGIVPELILSSTAKRAEQTVSILADAFKYPLEKIDWRKDFYQCFPEEFLEAIYALDDSIETVFIIAHNPGISMLATELSGTLKRVDLPTCGIAGITLETKKWIEISTAKKQLFLFDTPKQDHV
ncbi:MAG: histidine phosphatase family protein [Chitinophagaceae bacterium]